MDIYRTPSGESGALTIQINHTNAFAQTHTHTHTHTHKYNITIV